MICGVWILHVLYDWGACVAWIACPVCPACPARPACPACRAGGSACVSHALLQL